MRQIMLRQARLHSPGTCTTYIQRERQVVTLSVAAECNKSGVSLKELRSGSRRAGACGENEDSSQARGECGLRVTDIALQLDARPPSGFEDPKQNFVQLVNTHQRLDLAALTQLLLKPI